MDCLKKEALKHFENSRMKFQSHKLYSQALIFFFDHRSASDEKKWYRDTFKQRNGEAPQTFYLRFLEPIAHLQTVDLFLDDDAPGFDRLFMDDFFCKLNDECSSIVDNKRRDKRGNPEDFSPEDFFEWIDNAQAFSSSINSLVKHSKNETFSETSDDYCYYCGGTGHRFKNKSKWVCPDKLAGKPGCKEYYAYNNMKKQSSENITEATEQKVGTISAVALNTATNVHVTNKVSSNKRAVAVTTDISFKGTYSWFNQQKTILDLGGCENLVNSDFVKNHLQLPV